MKRRNVIFPKPSTAATIEGFSLLNEQDRERMLKLIKNRHCAALCPVWSQGNPLKRQRVY
jgi:hypothetical protein